MGVVRALLEAAFDGAIPARIGAVLPDDSVLDAEALAFVAGPIVPLRGATGVRAYVASPGQPDFERRVEAVVGGAGFLGASGRRMVDLDDRRAVLFRDDLHLADGSPVIAETLTLPGGTRGRLVRADAAPVHAPDLLRARTEAVASGLDGLWLTWLEDDRPVRWLVVNEDRWSGSPEPAALRLDALGDARWGALREVARRHRLAAYPDAVEVTPEGWHVTVGLFDPVAPARRH